MPTHRRERERRDPTRRELELEPAPFSPMATDTLSKPVASPSERAERSLSLSELELEPDPRPGSMTNVADTIQTIVSPVTSTAKMAVSCETTPNVADTTQTVVSPVTGTAKRAVSWESAADITDTTQTVVPPVHQ